MTTTIALLDYLPIFTIESLYLTCCVSSTALYSSHISSLSMSKSLKSKPKPKNTSKQKDPKQSHLYTDDNPSTTLHGTGFKDGATARHTISLVSQRSLTYQWQVINTMYHRAKGHPAMRRGDNVSDMKDAMAIFRIWLDETYPEAKEKKKSEGREFKPLLKKETVKKYLERIRALEVEDNEDLDDCKRFAEIYSGLAKGKRLANTLVNDAHPEKEDWEVRRERALILLNNSRLTGKEEDLWSDKGGASTWHLQCIGWAWSPVTEKRLPP